MSKAKNRLKSLVMLNGELRNRNKSLTVLNNELKRRLKRAVEIIRENNREKNTIQRNLKRAGEAVAERDDAIRKAEADLLAMKKRLAAAEGDAVKLKAANATLKDQVAAAKEDTERKSVELEAFKKQSSDAITIEKRNHAEEVSIMEMHVAGLQAQIKEMREKHPGSALLRDSSEKFPDGRPKTVLRTIYDGAWERTGNSLGITNPLKMQVKVE